MVLLVIVAAIAFAVFSGRDSGAEPDRPTGGKPQSNLNLPSSAAGSGVEQYELEVLAGLMKELPVYSVSRSDKRIALTIDAAWEDDKTDLLLYTTYEVTNDYTNDYFLRSFVRSVRYVTEPNGTYVTLPVRTGTYRTVPVRNRNEPVLTYPTLPYPPVTTVLRNNVTVT